MTYHETIWRFDTARFSVRCEIAPCEDDPRDCFQFKEDIEAVLSGRVAWFDASVAVYRVISGREVEVGRDSLGCCAYESARDFIESHRDPDPMNRNCSAMRAAHGDVVICHYFPDMVRLAIADARCTLTKLCAA